MRRRTDPAAIKERRAAADAGAVFEAAARSLAGALRSKRSLTERLIAAGYAAEHVAAAADRLEDLGIIDDERFARSLVESRDRSRQRGDRALVQELRRRGVEDDVIMRVLADRSTAHGSTGGLAEAFDAQERAARAAAAKLRPRGHDPRDEVQRIAQALLRRGFPSSLSWRIARERWAEADAEGGFEAAEDHAAE